MTNYLWVYGTLLSPIGSRHGQWLSKHADLEGVGWLAGDLYDLGQYPAFVSIPDHQRSVQGEVWKLKEAAVVWATLDPYESYDPNRPPEHNLYLREELLVRMQMQEVVCWVYTYHGPRGGLPLIQENDYYTHWRKNRSHQMFTGHA